MGKAFSDEAKTVGLSSGNVGVVNFSKVGASSVGLGNAASHEVGHGLYPGSDSAREHATGGVMAGQRVGGFPIQRRYFTPEFASGYLAGRKR